MPKKSAQFRAVQICTCGMSCAGGPTDIPNVQEREELPGRMAQVLELRAGAIASDAIALFPFAGVKQGDAERATRLVLLVVQLLMTAARDGEVDPRSPEVSELRRIARDCRTPVTELFGIVYLIERAVFDQLAVDDAIGAGSEWWPPAAQLLRRASFAVLAGFTERLAQEAGNAAVSDTLTTLHTRPVLVAVLEKEIQRSERLGHPFAVIVFDVDRLADINEGHGYRFGDRVLERIGIVLRNYFREQDWVTRCAGDKFAVLLPETQQEHAIGLAERVREIVEKRLALRDHRSNEAVPVTVSVAVVTLATVDSSIRADAVLREAEQAVSRAKLGGRNRVERVQIDVKSPLPPARGAGAQL